jgi:hypothetical protein
MLVCVFLCIFAHETAGAARIRLSLRPLVPKRASTQSSGVSRREIAEVYLKKVYLNLPTACLQGCHSL